jgi:putative endonuclease
MSERSSWRWDDDPQPLRRHPRESGGPASFLMKGGWLYMMADRYRGTIYTGVTADIARRAYQHRTEDGSEFVKRYGLLRLVYAEPYEHIEDAIGREKAIKKWRRQWKIDLIEAANPNWLDQYETLNGGKEEAGFPLSRE